MPHSNTSSSQARSDQLFARNLVLPIMDMTLHPSDHWKAKRYTKGLVSKIIKGLGEIDDCVATSNDLVQF